MSGARRTIAGVDGAPGGWVVARIGEDIRLSFEDSLDQLVSDLSQDKIETVAIDMPIGLSADGVRLADDEARARLGARRSTFFPTPTRAVLDAGDYAEANARNRHASGKGLSVQAWNLIPKIREVDELWCPTFEGKLVEAHPELSFAEIVGHPLDQKKATSEGRDIRIRALRNVFRSIGDVSEALSALPTRLHIDAIDALAVAWTARRVSAAQALQLGEGHDPAGRPMSVWI